MNLSIRTMTVLLAALAGRALAQPEVEPNNTRQTATGPFTAPATVSGSLTAGTDLEDWYAFTLLEPGTVRVTATPTGFYNCTSTDLVIWLYDASGAQITMDDDNGPEYCPVIETPTNPVANLPAGLYYVRVTQFTQDAAYDLHFDLPAAPMGTKFTYQGVLKENGAPLNGTKDVTFSLWKNATSTIPGHRVGQDIHLQSVAVNEGLLTAELDFGAGSFDGTQRFLQISVADAGQGPGGVLLLPRAPIAGAPQAALAVLAQESDHAARASLADFATNATYATVADSAYTALSANNVGWNSISGMPTGFADGVDDDGPWNVTGNVAWASGFVGIGTSNPGSFLLAVNGSAAKTGGGSWSTFCDSRLKHDIEPLSGTLDRLLGLRGYTFEYNADAVEKRLAMPGTQIGLMAEEVERVFPDWVERDADGYRYVTERATTALMVEALRDLRAEKDVALAEKQAQIDSLKAGNEALEARLRRLEERLAK